MAQRNYIKMKIKKIWLTVQVLVLANGILEMPHSYSVIYFPFGKKVDFGIDWLFSKQVP